MAKLARRQAPAIFPELLYWLESPLTTLLPFTSGQTFRVEDYIQDNRFVIRAELPGLDPDKDIEVTVDDGTLTIHAHVTARYEKGILDVSVPVPEARPEGRRVAIEKAG